MKMQTELGTIEISSEVFSSIIGFAANSCFGVKGMVSRSMSDGIVYLLRRDNLSKGVKVVFLQDESVNIKLHIAVEHGVNIPVISQSIIEQVRYIVKKTTGVAVSQVEICVESILSGK